MSSASSKSSTVLAWQDQYDLDRLILDRLILDNDTLAIQCSVCHIDLSDFNGLVKKDVRLVPNAAKLLEARLPGSHLNQPAAVALLEKLKELAPSIAKHYGLKSVVLGRLQMRLIKISETKDSAQDFQSYIALSYRWPQPEVINNANNADVQPLYKGRQNQDFLGGDSNAALQLPVSDLLFKALLNERRSPSEGVWTDQICINQDDEEEKAISVSAMDVIYQNARLVVVILADITVNKDESRVIQTLGRSLSSNQQLLGDPNFRSFWYKIVSASWFSRAWCRHEFYASRRHIFLIPCETGSSSTVLRFNGSFLERLISSCLMDLPPRCQSSIKAMESIHSYLSRLMDKVYYQRGDEARLGSLVGIFVQIFALAAGGNPRKLASLRPKYAAVDKLSIVLNSAGCKLYYKGPLIDETLCYRQIMTLALAAREPNALCTSGQQMRFGKRWSWIQEPVDSESRIAEFPTSYPPMQATSISLDPGPESRWISLDIAFLTLRGSPDDSMKHITHSLGETLESVFGRLMDEARTFLDVCVSMQKSNVGTVFPFYVPDHTTEQSAQSKSFSGGAFQTKAISLNFEIILVLTLRSCLLLGSSWIRRAYIPFRDLELKAHVVQSDFEFLEKILPSGFNAVLDELSTPSGLDSARRIVKFLMCLIMAGNPRPFSTISSQTESDDRYSDFISRRMPLPFITRSGFKGLVFSLYADEGDEASIKVAIPKGLLPVDYKDLSRVWLLGKHKEDKVEGWKLFGKKRCWRLLGKTRLIGDAGELCQSGEGWEIIPNQQVYGMPPQD